MRLALIRPVALFPLALVASACSFSHSSHSITSTFSDPEYGQVYMRTLDRERIAVAAYRDGELHGAEIAWRIENSWAEDWISSRTPVDPPQLPVWREKLVKLRELADAPGDDPTALLLCAKELPFSAARREALAKWVGDEPERAAQILDRYELADPDRAGSRELTELALQRPQSDERLAQWMVVMADENHRDAALLVARSDRAGPRTAVATLRNLDEFSTRSRPGLFAEVAPIVANDGQHAALVLDACDDLSSNDEAPAMLALLRSRDVDEQLAVRLLYVIDDFRTSDRLELLRVAAPHVRETSAGADALVAAVSELRTSERLAGARELLADAPGPQLVEGVMRITGDLPSRDRPRLIEAALAQPHWTPAVERAVHDAVGDLSGRSNRERMRAAVEARTKR
ncbi:MAG: hypothetical protein NXI31_18895 [bacterium]|nr:hypothetical protein [bacterium]